MSAVGGALIGAGMSFSMSCPGAMFVQMGAGFLFSWWQLAGGLTGAIVYGVIHGSAPTFFRPLAGTRQLFLHEYFGVPYAALALSAAVAFSAVILAVESIVPWNSSWELSSTTPASAIVNATWESVINRPAWPAWWGGITLGICQTVLVLVIGKTLGSSGAFSAMASYLFPSDHTYFKNYRGMQAHAQWQIVYAAFVMIGAFAASVSSGTYGRMVTSNPLMGFIGAFLFIFGSRLCAGCTSGHVLSDVGMLSFNSWVATAFMFVGGISTALVLYIVGGVISPSLVHL